MQKVRESHPLYVAINIFSEAVTIEIFLHCPIEYEQLFKQMYLTIDETQTSNGKRGIHSLKISKAETSLLDVLLRIFYRR